MYPKTTSRVAVLVAITLLLAGSTALAQTGDDYDLTWWTVDGGRGTLAGGGYALGSTVGQPDAAMWTGGEYTLAGGFWGGAAVEFRVYLPLVVRNF
jgi:hypothetical protein